MLTLSFLVVFWWLIHESQRANHQDFWTVAVPGYVTGVGTVLLAVVTVCAIRVSLTTTFRDRARADAARSQAVVEAEESVRREAAREDRAVLTRALVQAGMSYSECTTSLLPDARSRAYGEWKLSLRSAQRANGFPDLPTNDAEIEIAGVIIRDREAGADRFSRLRFKDAVVNEIAQALAEANAMTWEEYAHRRGLTH